MAVDPASAGPRRDWSVAALLLAVFCSSAATLAQATILGKLIYDLTGRELDLGLLGLAEFAPSALLILITGTVADRVDRRRVAMISYGGQGLLAGAMGWYAGTKPTSATPVFLLVLAYGVVRAFGSPAARALPADLVGAERLPKVVARYSGTWQAASIVGPVAGGLLYAVDVRLPFVAVMALLASAAAAMAVVRIPARAAATAGVGAGAVPAAAAAAAAAAAPGVAPVAGAPPGVAGAEPADGAALAEAVAATATAAKAAAVRAEVIAEAGLEASVEQATGEAASPGRATLREALEGLRFVRRQPLLLGAISLDLFAVLFGGAVALLPAIAKDRLGVGAVGLGWLRAAGGMGAALTTLMLAIRPIQRRVGQTLLVVVALFGMFTILLGLTKTFVVAFIAMAALSGADAISVFIRSTLVPLATPDDKRGRVLAVENVFIGASNELGAFESGVAGQLLGTAGAVVLGGAATLAIAGGWWLFFPTLRKVDSFPERASDVSAERIEQRPDAEGEAGQQRRGERAASVDLDRDVELR